MQQGNQTMTVNECLQLETLVEVVKENDAEPNYAIETWQEHEKMEYLRKFNRTMCEN